MFLFMLTRHSHGEPGPKLHGPGPPAEPVRRGHDPDSRRGEHAEFRGHREPGPSRRRAGDRLGPGRDRTAAERGRQPRAKPRQHRRERCRGEAIPRAGQRASHE